MTGDFFDTSARGTDRNDRQRELASYGPSESPEVDAARTKGVLAIVVEYDTLRTMLTISLASSVPIHDQLVAGLREAMAAARRR